MIRLCSSHSTKGGSSVLAIFFLFLLGGLSSFLLGVWLIPPLFPRDGGDLSWMPGSGASLIPGYFLPWCLILGRQIIRSGWGERRRARQWVLRQGAHLSTLSPVAAGARLGEIRWCWACMQGAQAVSGRLKGVWIWEGGASAACSLCLLLIRH